MAGDGRVTRVSDTCQASILESLRVKDALISTQAALLAARAMGTPEAAALRSRLCVSAVFSVRMSGGLSLFVGDRAELQSQDVALAGVLRYWREPVESPSMGAAQPKSYFGVPAAPAPAAAAPAPAPAPVHTPTPAPAPTETEAAAPAPVAAAGRRRKSTTAPAAAEPKAERKAEAASETPSAMPVRRRKSAAAATAAATEAVAAEAPAPEVPVKAPRKSKAAKPKA
jgi:hypothetical protein